MAFFFNDTATTEIYTLSLHDALPISRASRTAARQARRRRGQQRRRPAGAAEAAARDLADDPGRPADAPAEDRKSTRLNSSHANISYAVFCLTKKNPPSRLGLPPSPPP